MQGDDRGAGRAGRRHLVEARHLAELALERRGDRGGHHLRAGAGIEGLHLDRRVVDLGQRRERQEAVGDDADQQDRHHQQRGRDRPQDEEARRVHSPHPSPEQRDRSLTAATAAAPATLLPVSALLPVFRLLRVGGRRRLVCRGRLRLRARPRLRRSIGRRLAVAARSLLLTAGSGGLLRPPLPAVDCC